MTPTGAVFYRGPSLLTGAPIMGIVTGLSGDSNNPKTGAMAQAWILRSDLPPMDAKRQNLDDAICGDCKLRGADGRDSVCYVAPWRGPYQVYKAAAAGNYIECSARDAATLLEDRALRLGAYGDPVALPLPAWRELLALTDGWIGYTHQWRAPTLDPRWKHLVMASVDTLTEFCEAQAAGWRTFRMKDAKSPLIPGKEFQCPASDESGHRVTCVDCQLCRGLSSPARSVAINVHGMDSSLIAFHRRRPT